MVTNWQGENSQLNWDCVSTLPDITSRLWFKKVSVSSADGGVSFAGLTKKEVERLQRAFNLHWYTAKATSVHSFITQIDERIAQKGYFRTSHWSAMQSELDAFEKRLPPLPPEGELPPVIDAVFTKVWTLVSQPQWYLKRSREQYVHSVLAQHTALFDTVESMPLTEKQRLACVIDEDNNLVLAGAGTGKTSTVMGRVAFLIQSGKAKPDEILLLAYGNKAAKEMKERLVQRLGINGVAVNTFHSLGRSIVGRTERGMPSISPLAEDEQAKVYFVENCFNALQTDEAYRKQLLTYFDKWQFPEKNPFEFKTLGDYYNYLRDNEIRTLRNEQVKSFAECQIANYLFRQGINYQYEAKYKIDTKTPERRAYQPDFYLPDVDIYIEHFGIDRQGNTAPYIDKQSYTEGMQWKRELHKTHGTALIETFHYEQQEGVLLSGLERKLKAVGVQFNPLPDEAVLATFQEYGVINTFSRVLAELLSLFKRANLTEHELAQKISRAKHPEQMRVALSLLMPIYDAYQSTLQQQGHIDFDDMVNKAIGYVEEGRFVAPWRYILVDEFQDISRPRAQLIKALRTQQSDGSLFCVGDDWQSIYRFTGSDISLTAQFNSFFGATKTTALDKTFRFNNGINAVASRFVLKNPAQLNKDIDTHRQTNGPAVSVFRTSQLNDDAIVDVLAAIYKLAPQGATVYLLARFKATIPSKTQLQMLGLKFPRLNILTDTIHASKGKEADYVVLLGLTTGKFGLPSEIVTNSLVEALLPEAEPFPYAEERRLFYVAVTRARHRVYLLTDMTKASKFVQELMEEKYPLALDEFECSDIQKTALSLGCPKCTTGTLVVRKNNTSGNNFIGCTNYPLCIHTQKACPRCDSVMREQKGVRICINESCKTTVPVCPECGGDLTIKKGPYSSFYGCSNYRGDDVGSCRYKQKLAS